MSVYADCPACDPSDPDGVGEFEFAVCSDSDDTRSWRYAELKDAWCSPETKITWPNGFANPPVKVPAPWVRHNFNDLPDAQQTVIQDKANVLATDYAPED